MVFSTYSTIMNAIDEKKGTDGKRIFTNGHFDYERVRKALRELIKLIDRERQGIYYTDFKDEVIGVREGSPIYDVNDLDSYREKVVSYFKKYRDDLPVYKLRNNEELTKADIKYFEKILFEELGDKDSYARFMVINLFWSWLLVLQAWIGKQLKESFRNS